MRNRLWWGIALLALTVLVAGCAEDAESPPASPSPPPPTDLPSPTVVLAAPTQTPSGPTLTPSRTLPPTITPTLSATPGPPTEPPTATSTPGPYEYVIQAGDDCISILYKHGFNDLSAIEPLLRLNSLYDCRQLPGPGTRILVPRPTLRQLCELNAGPGGIDCRGCQWQSAHCCCPVAPVLSVGQTINIPAPTPTPTFTPTFTGSETPTPTPTHDAPRLIYPPDGAAVSGPVRLSWLTVGPLAADEMYLVSVRDETTGQTLSETTRRLSFDLPDALLLGDDGPRTFAWQVAVVRLGDDGLLYPAGAVQPEQTFTWRGPE